jgi:hypothetical protein
MSDVVKLGLAFTAMIGSAIGIDYMNRVNKSNLINQKVKGYKSIPVSKMSKYFLILLLLISLAVMGMAGFGLGKSTGAINKLQAMRAAQAMPPSPVVNSVPK